MRSCYVFVMRQILPLENCDAKCFTRMHSCFLYKVDLKLCLSRKLNSYRLLDRDVKETILAFPLLVDRDMGDTSRNRALLQYCCIRFKSARSNTATAN